MSETLNDPVVEQLFPKVVANHASKLPELEGVEYPLILGTVSDESLAFNDRLQKVALLAGNTAITDDLIREADILRLCANGREAEVEDDTRQAAYARSDTNQIKDASSPKDLDYYLTHGIEVIFDKEDREAAQRFCELDDRDVPLIEKLKAKRLFNINGFADSRVMYAVHDLIDHAWLFDSMRESGLMDRYASFLQTIDMGDGVFLYSRQAELLASVGFGTRRWPVAKSQGEELILDERTVDSVLSALDDPRTAQASRILSEMRPEHRQQALFMVENMAIQFADERRRWGAVKQADETTGVRKPMPLLDPLHVALMIETLNMLQRNRSYGGIQLAATVEVDNVLAGAMRDSTQSDRLYIPVPRNTRHRMSSESEDWINRHLSVSTSYNHIIED